MRRNDKKLHKLKYWREVIGRTQDDFALLIGCKRSNYSQKENGKVEIFLSEMTTIQSVINKELGKMGRPRLSLDEIFLP